MNFQTNASFTRSAAILSSHIDDEVVMMSSEMYYNLNPVASRIWELIETPQTIDTLTQQLMEEYEIDETTCRQETELFLQSLQDRNLIDVHA